MLSEYIKPLTIGNVTLKNNIIAAPVAGFSDFAFRTLCSRFGAGLTVTELTSAKGLCYNSKATYELIHTTEEESPKCIQIFGYRNCLFIYFRFGVGFVLFYANASAKVADMRVELQAVNCPRPRCRW